ncbi:hypothetical protein PVL29_026263 [Vitis rotundifolia]|uniref:Histone H2A n=1 Tax=Vitis rotundifolia TaxID=103349 RepID=A0AA38YM40_VITRO|nr:hypothetical protein PVL29_026263 [Vitis rotundifolia]
MLEGIANRRLHRILAVVATLVGHGDGAFGATAGGKARSRDRKWSLLEKLRRGPVERKGGDPKKKPISRSIKTSLQFPVSRIDRCLKKGLHSQRVGTDALVYLAVMLEWLLLSKLQLEVYCLHWKR